MKRFAEPRHGHHYTKIQVRNFLTIYKCKICFAHKERDLNLMLSSASSLVLQVANRDYKDLKLQDGGPDSGRTAVAVCLLFFYLLHANCVVGKRTLKPGRKYVIRMHVDG